MSRSRVVLVAVLALLVLPSFAYADGIVMDFLGGRVLTPRPTNFSFTPATNTGGGGASPSTLNYITATVGGLGGTPVPPTYGTPNVFVPPFDPGSSLMNFGTVSYSTGPATGFSGSLNMGDFVTFAGGGFVNVVSNAALATATGGAIPAGTTIFSGFFSGPVTLTQFNSCPPLDPTCLTTFNYFYSLSGPVQGVLDPLVLAHFGLGSNPNSVGFLLTLNFGFIGPTDTLGNPEAGRIGLVVPEPGTLALFGTGLIGLAGVLRRRLGV